jgi:thiol-disulfide isomerase/thioredoxin
MKTLHDLTALRAASEPVNEHIVALSDATEAFTQRLQEYELNPIVTEKLKAHAGKAYIFVFSAEWCPDCYRNVPVLKLIQDATGIEVRVLGNIMRDAKNPNPRTPEEKWKIPPSPPELMEFMVFNIPYIAVLNPQGEELGAVIENPPEDKTLEEALLAILQAA